MAVAMCAKLSKQYNMCVCVWASMCVCVCVDDVSCRVGYKAVAFGFLRTT